MRMKKVPMRKCTGCNEVKEKRSLVRIVKAPENAVNSGEISVDLTGKKPGRGAYICNDSLECLKKAKKAGRLERAFSCKIPEDVYDRLAKEISDTAGEEGN